MSKENIKLAAAIGIGLLLVIIVAVVGYMKLSKAAGHALDLEEQLSSSKAETQAFQKYIEVLPLARQSAIDVATKLSTTIEDELTWIEKGEKGVPPFKLEGTAVLKLSIAYTFGFDLAGGKFDLVPVDKGIQVKLGTAQMIGAPQVTVTSAEYPPKVLAVEDAAATQEILQKAMPAIEERGRVLAQNEAVRIVAERKLLEHLRSYLQKHKDVKIVPDMAVAEAGK